MADSARHGPVGHQNHHRNARHRAASPARPLVPPKTPGTTGLQDQADTTLTTMPGWSPDVTGLWDWADPARHDRVDEIHRVVAPGTPGKTPDGQKVATGSASAAPTLPGPLSRDPLKKLFKLARDDVLVQVAAEIDVDPKKFELDTPLRRAHFFGQILGEGGESLDAGTEKFVYSHDALKQFDGYQDHPAEADSDDGIKDAAGKVTHHAAGVSPVSFWVMKHLAWQADKGAAPEVVDTVTDVIDKRTPSREKRKEDFKRATMSSAATSDGRRFARWALVAVLGNSAIVPVLAAPATHCRADEQPLFSCSTGKKTVSLCGAPATGVPQKLSYRFGVPGKVENEFVATSANHNRFRTTAITLSPGANVEEVWFDRGDVRYLLSACTGGDCPVGAALTVLEKAHVIANMPCRDDDDFVGRFGSDLVEFGDVPKPKTPLLVIDDNYDNEADRIFAIPGLK